MHVDNRDLSIAKGNCRRFYQLVAGRDRFGFAHPIRVSHLEGDPCDCLHAAITPPPAYSTIRPDIKDPH